MIWIKQTSGGSQFTLSRLDRDNPCAEPIAELSAGAERCHRAPWMSAAHWVKILPLEEGVKRLPNMRLSNQFSRKKNTPPVACVPALSKRFKKNESNRS
jgi:hypothetical protein